MSDEFTIANSGIHFHNSRFDYAWFQLQLPDGRRVYRAITWLELTYIPIGAREDPDFLGKQWMAIRGLYNGQVDFSYIAAGFFNEHIGIAQFYGAQAEDNDPREAVALLRRRLAAVRGVLANYPQSRLRVPTPRRITLLLEQMRTLPRILAILGHPDPRLAERGMGRDGSLGEADDELVSQQGEMLLRGLAALRNNFVFAVAAKQIARQKLVDGLIKAAQLTTPVASRQKGSVGASFGISFPWIQSFAQGVGGQTAHTHAITHGQSHATSQAQGVTNSHSTGHSVGQSHMDSVSNGTSWSHSTGGSVTHSASNTVSSSHSVGGSHVVGHSTAHSVANGVTNSVTQSQSHGISNSVGHSHSVSNATSHGTSQGVTNGTSQSSSQSVSHVPNVTSVSHSSTQMPTVHSQSRGQSNVPTVTSHSHGVGTSVGSSTTQPPTTVSRPVLNSQQQNTLQNLIAHGVDWKAAGHAAPAPTPAPSASGTPTPAPAATPTPAPAPLSPNQPSHGIDPSQLVGMPGNVSLPASTHGHGWNAGLDVVGLGYKHNEAGTAPTNPAVSIPLGGANQTQMAAGGQGHSAQAGMSFNHGASTVPAHTIHSQSNSWTNPYHTTSHGSSTVPAHDIHGSSQMTGSSHSNSFGTMQSQSHGVTNGVSHAHGTSQSWGTAQSHGISHVVGNSVGNSVANGKSWADTVGQAHSTGVARSSSWGDSVGGSHVVSHADGTSESWSTGDAHGTSKSWGSSQGQSSSQGNAYSVGGGRSVMMGASGGVAPFAALSRNWQTEDHVAMRTTETMTALQSVLNDAASEGGFWTTAMLMVEDRATEAAKALATQSFHGAHVPQPIMVVDAGETLRAHALTLRPSLQTDPANDLGIDVFVRKWSTMHTPSMLAALTAPNLMEEGTAVTVQERIPPLAFYPDSGGKCVLGHQISPETGLLTNVPLHLSEDRHFHTAFFADTGYGKTVAAERMVLETTVHFKTQTIVLDFGDGWRTLLNAPGLRNAHVDIRQLSPGGVRPLRWNPLQIARNILPEVQIRAFADIFTAVAQLGTKRQNHELRILLHGLYAQHGILTRDAATVNDPKWGRVQPNEAQDLGLPPRANISTLTKTQLQELAVYRSHDIGLVQLYEYAKQIANNVRGKSIQKDLVEGVMARLEALIEGEMAMQFGPGHDAPDIAEVAPQPWGVTILEGGALLDTFSRAFLLGWFGHLYYLEVVIDRKQGLSRIDTPVQMVFEEANKIFGTAGNSDEGSSKATTAQQFADMWRDSRKYNFWMHIIAQTPSDIPEGIRASCNNLFIGQLKDAKDEDIAMAMIHRSPRGFTDEAMRRFIGSLPKKMMMVKLGYSGDRAEVEPILIQPLMVRSARPTDEQIAVKLGRITL